MSSASLAAPGSRRPTRLALTLPLLSLGLLTVAVAPGLTPARAAGAGEDAATGVPAREMARLERDHARVALPLLKQYCLDCHSTAKQKGDLDLERFRTVSDIVRHPKVWQGVVEQMALGEMPPKDKPQPTEEEKTKLLGWVHTALDAAAKARAGDPGPVVLRRLNNAEYTHTIRDLTGVPALDPAREFPADSAAGEGFMNTGNSLVMSPALLTKYLDAAKDVTRHAVMLPDGIGFSSSSSQRDWAEERLAAIRAFYGRYSVPGGGSSVNLQGIKFDTKDGGVLPLERYLDASLAVREARGPGGTAAAVRRIASERNLSPKYLATLHSTLSGTDAPLLFSPVRAAWRSARPGDTGAVASVATSIVRWQQALWRFTQVGHIGKRDGPKAWQMPVTPIATAREVRLKIPAPAAGQEEVRVYLAASDAGDGSNGDDAVWEQPRLVASGRPDLPLRDLRAAVTALERHRHTVFGSTTRALAAAAELAGEPTPDAVAQLAAKHGLDTTVLAAWLDCLGIGAGVAVIDSHMTQKLESAQGYDFIKGWTGADALSVLANASGQHVRIPGNMKPHSVAAHPSPKRRVLLGWRSPIRGQVRAEGSIQHAHSECGNGVTWALELRRGNTRQRLAAGVSQGAQTVPFGPIENLALNPGDILSVVIGPRDGNHSCDLTAVDLRLRSGDQEWDLAKDVSSDLLAGNPHADRLGHPGVWHFYSEPDKGGTEPILPAGSLLARWQSAPSAAERSRLAGELQQLLTAPTAPPGKDSPDGLLRRQLLSINGPLFRSVLSPERLAALRSAATPNSGVAWGLDPALFGTHPSGADPVAASDLCVKAPSVLEIRIPAALAEGSELVATGRLHPKTGATGSVQMLALTSRPAPSPALAAGAVRTSGGKGTWSDGELPSTSDAPILVAEGADNPTRRRIEAEFAAFRDLFPAALCYTKIVPVDEVVTLTLYYREDDALRRLMLDDAAVAELERLWAELHYVSHDALKLVDAFEQLWQYATQDADPSAFEPMRKPIQERAAAFRQLLTNTQPAHVEGVLRFAHQAYRRPLEASEQTELRNLYRTLRDKEIPHEEAVRLTLARVLVSPAFLYRAEKAGPGERPGPVSDHELATRLSYFLWSSMPDATLRRMAVEGRLRRPDVLAAEAARLLRDPRARRLATEFACTWLHIYDFDQLGEKSERHFPTFNSLKGPMYEETILFFTDLFQRNGSVLEILDADHTFVNPALARHYDLTIPASARPAPAATGAGPDWRRVDGLRAQGRGGILGQATTLAKQSGASRTSPILRGNWLCEVLLGEKLPRPPKDVPRLPEDEATESLTVRQLTEKHSSDPKCYGCHRRIDPYGYSLEAFDAIGRRREKDLAGHAIDVKTTVMDGSAIDGLDGLRGYLLTKRRDAFVKQFCRKLLGYALGRGVMLSDEPLLAEMRKELKADNYRIGTAVETIVRSRQFREIRGRDMAADE